MPPDRKAPTGTSDTILSFTDLVSKEYNFSCAFSKSDSHKVLLWYKNDGLGNFKEQSIISTEADNFASIHFGDLDNDGNIDFVAQSVSVRQAG